MTRMSACTYSSPQVLWLYAGMCRQYSDPGNKGASVLRIMLHKQHTSIQACTLFMTESQLRAICLKLSLPIGREAFRKQREAGRG